MRAANCFRCLLILLLLMPGLFLRPTGAEVYAQNTAEQALDREPQTAPAQNWSTEQGKLKATGSLSASGADGNATLSDNSETWAWQVGGRAGMLNEEFAFGVKAAGGWSPGGDWGLWLNLDGEFTGEFVDHYQATLNAGYRLNQDLRLLGTLDYLGKTVEVESWEKDEMLSQYGAGLSLDYSLMQCIDLSGFYQHYKTEGQEYGKIRSYEYVDSDNWQHYGWLYGAVRGGDYDEIGVDANYNLSELGMTFGVGISQRWRTYEEMLGYDSKSTETAAGRLSYGWNDIMTSGVNLKAGISMEFATNDNLSWNLSFDKQVGPVSVALTYSEYANDQTTSDRRLYASVNMPIGLAAPEVKAEVSGGPRKPAFGGQWLSNPVTGMGTPDLKVSETLERRIDETLVDLDQLADNTTISKNVMTISGLPVLTGVNTTYSKPASALSAFSIGSGNTSVIVDLEKLPCPANVAVTFNQQDGLYTSVSFITTEGSIKVKNAASETNLSQSQIEAIQKQAKFVKMDYEVFNPSIKGPTELSEGETGSYQLSTGAGAKYIITDNSPTSVDWNATFGTILSSGKNGCDAKAGSHWKKSPYVFSKMTVSADVFYFAGEVVYYATPKIVVEITPASKENDTGDDTGGEDLPNFMKNKTLYVENAGEHFKIGFDTDASGKPTFFVYTKGSADMSSLMSSYTATRGSDGKVSVAMSISVPIDGKDTDFEMDLNLDKDDVTLLGTSNVRVSPTGGSTTTYKVTGYIK